MRQADLLCRAWRLAPAEKRLALESAAMLGFACLAVRCVPARWLPSILRWTPASRRRDGDRDPLFRMLERVVRIHPCRPRCLEQAVAGRWMLARRGCASTLVIGARTRAFGAHAWLEIDDRVEPSLPDVTQYEPLWRSADRGVRIADRGLRKPSQGGQGDQGVLLGFTGRSGRSGSFERLISQRGQGGQGGS